MRGKGVRIDVLTKGARWGRAVPGAADLARRAARAALGACTATSGEIAIVLSDNATVQQLNRDYRHQDKPTNVLSFPLDDPTQHNGLLGDVILARETVLAEAAAQAKSAGDHLSHLVVHGVLHLLGYDHVKVSEARRMETLERRVLAGLGISDPYRRPAVRRGQKRAAA
jgi:probable rRNA maturation factor